MGLDMYIELRKEFYKTYLTKGEIKEKSYLEHYGDYKYASMPEELKEFGELNAGRDASKLIKETCTYPVGYFRKFNALHKWIDRHSENGVENCKEIELDEDTIDDLICTLEKVLEAHDEASSRELFPTTEGFFFGSAEYDEYYYTDCADALELFKKIRKILQKDTCPAGVEPYKVLYKAWW